MLVNELQDKAAPLYVIALWAHCQQRKSDRFTDLAPNALKAICGYEGEASKLRRALELCEFIEVEGSAIVAHGWAETNAKLVKNWENGGRGGRPRNPTETQRKPNHNPTVTETGFGVTQTEPIEKRREEEIEKREESMSALGEPKTDPPLPNPRKRANATPYDRIFALYAEHCPSLAQMRIRTSKRDAGAKRLWGKALSWAKGRGGGEPEAWGFVSVLFDAAQASPFLRGERPGKDHPNWRADFEFVTRDESMAKIMEGAYDR